MFADVMYIKGAAVNNIVGDLSMVHVPSRLSLLSALAQPEVMYNGHKRVHAFKYQFLTTPNGLMAHLFGPDTAGGNIPWFTWEYVMPLWQSCIPCEAKSSSASLWLT